MITVIIPVLNAMPYLHEALASLEAQTFKDFEVYLWDNGSTDGGRGAERPELEVWRGEIEAEPPRADG